MFYRRSTPRTRKRLILTVLTIILSIFSAILSVSCNLTDHDLTGNAFGSYFSIEYTGENRDDELRSVIDLLDHNFDTDGNGDVAKINSAPVNSAVTVNEYTFAALTLAFEVAEASGEAFTPAAFPLTELWGFAPNNFTGTATSVPSAERVSEVLNVVGIRHFSLDKANSTVTKLTDGAKLDLGGIGKGFAAETVRNMLGDKAKVIDFGATFYISDPVKVSIQNPRGDDLIASATVSHSSVATSGDYQRYYIFDGVRYHHIMGINGYPSGYGAADPVISATVTSPNAAISDALSTAAMVLGNTVELETLLNKYNATAVLFTASAHYYIGDTPFIIN